MEELKKYYGVKLAEFEQLHKRWVQSNKNRNSLYMAKEQIHAQGDTSADFALEVIEKAMKDEKRKNDDLCYKVNALAGFLLDMEVYIQEHFDEILNGVNTVRGY